MAKYFTPYVIATKTMLVTLETERRFLASFISFDRTQGALQEHVY